MSEETEVKERPILFRGEMVRGILEGRKTMTRRVVKEPLVQPFPDAYFDAYNGGPVWCWWTSDNRQCNAHQSVRCPFGSIGDILWARETWQAVPVGELRDWRGIPEDRFRTPEPNRPSIAVIYRADGEMPGDEIWRPSIFMPRRHCRLVLEITDIRVERLNSISEEDAIAEGAKAFPTGYVFEGTAYDKAGLCHNSPSIAFACLWDEIHGPDSWAQNPWVWIISFRRVEA